MRRKGPSQFQLVRVSALRYATSAALRHPSTLIKVGKRAPYPKDDRGRHARPRVMHADKARLPPLLAALLLPVCTWPASCTALSRCIGRQSLTLAAQPHHPGTKNACLRSRPSCAALSSLCCFLQRCSWSRAWPGAVRVLTQALNPRVLRAIHGWGAGRAPRPRQRPQIARLCLAQLPACLRQRETALP